MPTAEEVKHQLTPVTAPMAASVQEPVKPFGKYFLVRKLAEGGMAEIFLAKLVGAEGFERDVVIKRMLKHLSSVNDFVNMFLDEAKLAARLVHPNVIQINELGEADGCFFICMEYLPGEDFSTMVRTAGRKREYVPFHVVARVVADAAHGLHFAHEFTDSVGKTLGIVHRDVSPSNIYVTYQGQVKVLDFGIAKAESRITNTTAGVVKGKYMYMAPEQARGAPVDRRADVFSLGVSLYEALTHYRPFSRENDLAILNAVLKCDFKPPRELRKDFPRDLEAIILRAMAARVEDRYPTAQAMAEDLEKFVSAHATDAGQHNVGAYVRALFGDSRVINRTKIPSLTELAQSGVEVPGFSPEAKTRAAARPGETDPSARAARLPKVIQVKPSDEATGSGLKKTVTTSPSSVRTVRKGGAGLLAVGVMLGVFAFGGAFAALKFMPGLSSAPAPPPEPAPKPVEPPTPPPPPPVDQTNSSGGNDTKTPFHPPPPKRVQLDTSMIQKTVSRGSGPIMECFQSFPGDLPTDQGQMKVQFTILASGKVSKAEVMTPNCGPGVSGCVVAQVTKMKFQQHTESELTITVPFQYRVRQRDPK